MLDSGPLYSLLIATFAIGYVAIVLEPLIRLNKTASALVTAVILWMLLFLRTDLSLEEKNALLLGKLDLLSEIVFFLIGAMTLVELIDSHNGFQIITQLIRNTSKKRMLWMVGIATFFLSSVLDNLATALFMLLLLRQWIPDRDERLLLGGVIVIAANAGGAWTPIGDVTTTLLWIHGNISSFHVMKTLFIPSLCSLLVALILFGWKLKGSYPRFAQERVEEPGARLVFFSGIGALIFIPVFKHWTGLPPFMGMFCAIAFLWILTDWLHGSETTRSHLRIPFAFSRIDTPGILFFLAILLAVAALDAAGLLQTLALAVNAQVPDFHLLSILIGLLSSVIDNVPLTAACMGMYDLQTHPLDSPFWLQLAYSVGTGGSLLVFGSAAGIVFMNLEKVRFFWYLRRVSLIALISYFAGIGILFLQKAIFSV